MGLIFSVAFLAPVKRVDAVLQEPVHLQSEKTTVASLSEYCRLNRKALPLAIDIPPGGGAVERQISLSSTQMPLQQFITEVEQQTGCTHCFSGCGNRYSLLYDRAYNFGLRFTPPANSLCRWV